jgi:hypothetical protein
MPSAQFHVQPDGVWLEVESPSGKRAAVNLRDIGLAVEAGQAFREWCDWHVERAVATDS